MHTECTATQLEFQAFGRRRVSGRFDGGRLTSDGGGLLLREVEQQLDVFSRLAGCFTDYRQAGKVEHPVAALLAQRIYGLALGYEDINDHDALRSDSLLALLVGKADLTGDSRRRARDRGYPLAGSSTLNRLELGVPCEAPGHHLGKALRKSQRRYLQTGRASRRFREWRYRTLKRWSRTRRVVAKAEYLAKGANPRFVVTNLDNKTAGAQVLYEDLYCIRGERPRTASRSSNWACLPTAPSQPPCAPTSCACTCLRLPTC